MKALLYNTSLKCFTIQTVYSAEVRKYDGMYPEKDDKPYCVELRLCNDTTVYLLFDTTEEANERLLELYEKNQVDCRYAENIRSTGNRYRKCPD